MTWPLRPALSAVPAVRAIRLLPLRCPVAVSLFGFATAREIRQNCCGNATLSNNLRRNGHNAQKGGRCLPFLLHCAVTKFQIDRGIWLQSVSPILGAMKPDCFFESDGDRHEETGFGRRSAGNDCGFNVGG
jgi:hypothetical protein